MSGPASNVSLLPGAEAWPWTGSGCSPERALWCEVLVRALRDAAGHFETSRSTYATLDRRRAHEWITRDSRDFQIVCTLAGLDPVAVRDAYLAGRIDLGLYYDSGKVREAEA